MRSKGGVIRKILPSLPGSDNAWWFLLEEKLEEQAEIADRSRYLSA